MSVQSNAEFRQQTRAVLQESAGLFRQGKGGDALDLLQFRIVKPYQNKELTDGQWQAFCQVLHLDPHSESMDLSNREFQTPSILRAQALRDFIAGFSKEDDSKEFKRVLEAITQAAQILELLGDMDAAWKALHEVLPVVLREKPLRFFESIVKESYRIMLDDLRKPSSFFLQQRMKSMARSLDSLSFHFFDEKLQKGDNNPQNSVSLNPSLATFSTLIPRQICTLLEAEDLDSLLQTSKTFNESAKSSLEFREESTLEDLQKWLKKGVLNKPLTALHVIKREKDLPIDKRELESILTFCPNLKILDLGCGSNHINADHISIVGRCCPNLLSFSLNDFTGRVAGSGNLLALSNCHKLKKVSLRCHGLSSLSVQATNQFLKGCKDLEDLGLEGFLLGDNVFEMIGNAGLPLKRIVIGPAIDPRNGLAVARNTSAAYISLFKGNPHLEEVILGNNPCLKNDALKALADHCPLITKLDVSNNEFISEEGLRSVVNNCKLLHHLDIEDFRGDISKVFEKSPCQVTHVSFKRIVTNPSQIIDFLRKNPDLISIDLPIGVTEEVLSTIRKSCPNIRRLTISPSDGRLLQSKGMRELAEKCNCFISIAR